MTIPANFVGGVVCMLLSIVIHLLIKLLSAVSDQKTDVAVTIANVKALDADLKSVASRVTHLEHEHKSALRSQTA